MWYVKLKPSTMIVKQKHRHGLTSVAKMWEHINEVRFSKIHISIFWGFCVLEHGAVMYKSAPSNMLTTVAKNWLAENFKSISMARHFENDRLQISC